ncbi:MAG: hypothetical protein HY752_01295 [Nitrospirae bacterium]|nr:hypothetical protein [Nitrospirota bacterium]
MISNIWHQIPFPLLLICLFFFIASGVRRIGLKNKGTMLSTFLLAILLLWMVFPILPFSILSALIIVGASFGLAFAHREPVLKIITFFLVADVLLISINQLIEVSGIARRLPPLEFLIRRELVYFYFTEIVIGSLLVAVVFLITFLVINYVLKVGENKIHHGSPCFLVTTILTYVIQQFLHLEHPEMGYRVFPNGNIVKYTNLNTGDPVSVNALDSIFKSDGSIIIPQYVSILSYGGIFWTVVLILVVGLSIVFGVALSHKGVLSEWYQRTSRLIVFGVFYFSFYHIILMSFLYSDYDLLNGLMMILLSAITIPFGALIGYSLNEMAIHKENA